MTQTTLESALNEQAYHTPEFGTKIVSDEEIQLISEVVVYHDTSRTLTLRTLAGFFLLATLHEQKSFRHGADVAKVYGLRTSHYSTVSKKAKEVPYDIMKRLFALIVSKCTRQIRCSLLKIVACGRFHDRLEKSSPMDALSQGTRRGNMHIAYSPEQQMRSDIVETVGLRHDGPPVREQLSNILEASVEKIDEIHQECWTVEVFFR